MRMDALAANGREASVPGVSMQFPHRDREAPQAPHAVFELRSEQLQSIRIRSVTRFLGEPALESKR